MTDDVTLVVDVFRSFDANNRFLAVSSGAIQENIVVEFDRDTGHVVSQWGSNMLVVIAPFSQHLSLYWTSLII